MWLICGKGWPDVQQIVGRSEANRPAMGRMLTRRSSLRCVCVLSVVAAVSIVVRRLSMSRCLQLERWCGAVGTLAAQGRWERVRARARASNA